MKVLWLSWKDKKHPQSGGAEVVQDQLCRRLVQDGHEVIVLTAHAEGQPDESMQHGYKVIRNGSRYSVYWMSYRYYKKHLQGWADLVVDEVNTVPFFAKYYVREPNVLFIHQLSREIWFYQFVHFGIIGYLLEPMYLRLLNNKPVVTVSQSTKRDLVRHGFDPKRIHIISEGIEAAYLDSLPPMSEKFSDPTVLSLGSIRPMKRTMHQVKAFELAKQRIPNLKMIVSGSSNSRYGKRVLKAMATSPYAADITYAGRVSNEEKHEIMKRCHAVLVTSIKEGWCLVVTEANAMGTPAVVYNVDGLRDSVKSGVTGLVAEKNTPDALASELVSLLDSDVLHQTIRRAAWEWSKSITFEQSYQDLKGALEI